MAVAGIAAGLAGGFALARIASRFLPAAQMPGVLPVACSGAVLLVAAVAASALPAARAARVDVVQALRSD
jgi:ABC-type antimicrobial peptide transport system permease subunit